MQYQAAVWWRALFVIATHARMLAHSLTSVSTLWRLLLTPLQLYHIHTLYKRLMTWQWYSQNTGDLNPRPRHLTASAAATLPFSAQSWSPADNPEK